jgi:hypothetical protein
VGKTGGRLNRLPLKKGRDGMDNKKLSGGTRAVRGIFTGLAGLFLVGVIVQVFLAGAAIFADGGFWGFHTSFIHFFEWIPLAMLILSFFGRIPAQWRWQSFGLLFMIILQYVTANLSGSLPYLSAVHPIIALILFWRSLVVVQGMIQLWKEES